LVGVAETGQDSEGGRRESSLLTFGHTKVRQNKIIPQATVGRPLKKDKNFPLEFFQGKTCKILFRIKPFLSSNNFNAQSYA